MKKIIVWLLTFFSVYSSIAQPVTSRSSPTITVADSRLMGVLNMFAPRYTDTTAANVQKGIDSAAAVIYTYDCNCLWFRQLNPKKWSHVVTVDGRIDTLFAQRPAFFDSVTRFPNTILKILQGNGLVEGGRVTLDSCFSIDVAPGLISLNYNQITFAQVIRLSLAAADVFDRTDAVIVDSFGVVSILKGAAGNIAPYIDPSSQVLLATIPVPANATCLDVTQEIIYDQNTGSPEWSLTTFGTITANPNNAANPFHLSKAYFISTYADSSALIFTKPSGNDTVHAGEILKFFPYFNGLFNNQLIGQFYLGSTPASSRIVLNPYFNINDSNQYQIGAVPLSAWSWPGGSIFNKLVLSFAGFDTSGAKGLYLDWIQLQTGILNVSDQSSGSGINIYNTDSVLRSNRIVGLNAHSLTVTDGTNDLLVINPNDFVSQLYANDGTAVSGVQADANTTGNLVDFYLAALPTGALNSGALIEGDGIAKTIEYTADTHTFAGGPIIYNTPPSGAITDSVLTWDAATKTVNKRPTDNVVTLQNAFDASVARSDNPQINGHSGALDIDSLNEFAVNVYDGANLSQIVNAFSSVVLQVTNAGGNSGVSVTDGGASMHANDNVNSLDVTLTPELYKIQANSSDGSIARVVVHVDSLTATNNNNIAYFNPATHDLLMGHLNAPTIATGTAPPATTPAHVGDVFIDTSAKKIYFASGTSSSADWTIAN